MALQDWEPRALPSEARCRVWAEKGGLWYVVTEEPRIVGSPCLIAIGWHQEPRWRPIRANGDPAPWSEFFSATHPPIPEGLERIGEWRTGLGAPRDLPLVFLEDGTIMRDPGLILGSVWFCEVRRVAPPVDWGDVPKGIYLKPYGMHGAMRVHVPGGGTRGLVAEQRDGSWLTEGPDGIGSSERYPSQPAAIVALTGRRTG